MRRSVDVVTELLDTMERIVNDYGNVVRTPSTIDGLVGGTSFFPGGSGLWRGVDPDGPLPEFFPKVKVMFVGNNWSNEDKFRKAIQRRSEDIKHPTAFFAVVRSYVRVCGLREDQCFFTNSLMGLIPGNGKTIGPLTGDGPNFRRQCRMFFDEQLRIVQPKLVAVMGDYAKEELKDFRPENSPLKVEIPHPSSVQVKASELDATVAKRVSNLIAAVAAL